MIQPLIALDQLLNSCIKLKGEWGMCDEMLSARAWRLRDHCRLNIWIDWLFWWDLNHCEECYRIEKKRKQLPAEYRK